VRRAPAEADLGLREPDLGPDQGPVLERAGRGGPAVAFQFRDPAVGKLPGAGELLLGPVEVSAFPGVVTELVGLHDLAAQAPVLAVQATGAGDQIPAGTQIGRASCRESGRVPGAAGPAEERAK